MQTLFYVSAGSETQGPYTSAQVKSMWAAGLLTADALYWEDDAQIWAPLIKIAESQTSSPGLPRPEAQHTAETTAKPQFARRLVARFIDLQLFGTVGLFLSELVASWFHLSLIPFVGYIIFAFGYGAEIFWLIVFRGSTPGKWLFGLWVQPDVGAQRASVFRARTWSVYWRCTLFCAPFCLPLAYRDLKRTGSTKWDKKSGTHVLHERVGLARQVIGVVLAVTLVLLSVVSWIHIFKQASERAPVGVSATEPSMTPDEATQFDPTADGFTQDEQRMWWKTAVHEWPDLEVQRSPLRNEYDRLLKADEADRGYEYPYLTAKQAAKNLGIRGVSDPAGGQDLKDAFTPTPSPTPSVASAAKANYDDEVNLSWQRVAMAHHDAGVPGTPLHSYLTKRVAEIYKTDPAYFSKPDWPERLTAECVATPPLVAAPPPPTHEPDTYPPIMNAVIEGPFGPSFGYGKITIINGTDHAAIVKVHEWNSGRKFVSFSVLAHSSYAVDVFPDNSYRVLFGLGDRMHPRASKFSPTISAFQFDKPMTFQSSVDSSGVVHYLTFSLTLNTVPDGNATSTEMRPVDFDAW